MKKYLGTIILILILLLMVSCTTTTHTILDIRYGLGNWGNDNSDSFDKVEGYYWNISFTDSNSLEFIEVYNDGELVAFYQGENILSYRIYEINH